MIAKNSLKEGIQLLHEPREFENVRYHTNFFLGIISGTGTPNFGHVDVFHVFIRLEIGTLFVISMRTIRSGITCDGFKLIVIIALQQSFEI